ncbi:MAG: class I SAM-dependent methyltransferase [Calditrichaeota bacterium]|nr:MAG: class I SAM-dependent methyltransferase [Calditrichota bacterium]
MEDNNRKKHWETIYQNVPLDEMGWHQTKPVASLNFLRQCHLPLSAKIIDVGGGDSLFVDYLLDAGYSEVTILDVSETALARAKKRLGPRATKVNWVYSDVLNFQPTNKFDFWHDRATFHFLIDAGEIKNYLNTANRSVVPGGNLVIGTFSKQGPQKCSGLEITQYSEESITDILQPYFKKNKCVPVDHKTPSGAVQNYIFCRFQKTTSV